MSVHNEIVTCRVSSFHALHQGDKGGPEAIEAWWDLSAAKLFKPSLDIVCIDASCFPGNNVSAEFGDLGRAEGGRFFKCFSKFMVSSALTAPTTFSKYMDPSSDITIFIEGKADTVNDYVLVSHQIKVQEHSGEILFSFNMMHLEDGDDH